MLIWYESLSKFVIVVWSRWTKVKWLYVQAILDNIWVMKQYSTHVYFCQMLRHQVCYENKVKLLISNATDFFPVIQKN
jgi:hypothetical protein